MGVCYSLFGCGDSKTAVAPMEEHTPTKCDSEKTNVNSLDRRVFSEIGQQDSPLKDTEVSLRRSRACMDLPGRIIYVKPINTPQQDCVETAEDSATACVRLSPVLDKHQAEATFKERRPSPPKSAVDPVHQASGSKETFRQRQPLSAWGEVEEIPVPVHGSAPKPAHWKELYQRVLKPREQVMAIYLNTMPATRLETGQRTDHEDCSGSSTARVEVQTPLARREDRLRMLRARVKQKLRKPRLRKKDSRRRPSRGTSDWDIGSVISVSEDGDEDEVILYSTYKSVDQDSEYFASDETEARENSTRKTPLQDAFSVKRESLGLSSADEETVTLNRPTPTRKASKPVVIDAVPGVAIQRKESWDDVEEILVLPEERAQPRKPKGRVLRNSFFRKSSNSQY